MLLAAVLLYYQKGKYTYFICISVFTLGKYILILEEMLFILDLGDGSEGESEGDVRKCLG